MLSYKDKTFCISPNCKNECGIKLTEEIKQDARRLELPICAAYLCDVPNYAYQSKIMSVGFDEK